MTIRIHGIIWLDSVIEKISTKHSVSCAEVRQVLQGRTKFRFIEKGHRPDENVYAALGQTQSWQVSGCVLHPKIRSSYFNTNSA